MIISSNLLSAIQCKQTKHVGFALRIDYIARNHCLRSATGSISRQQPLVNMSQPHIGILLIAICAWAPNTACGQMGLPAAQDLFVEEADELSLFSVGNVLFFYPTESLPKANDPPAEFSKLISVQDAVARARPDQQINTLVKQQLRFAHRFDLMEAAAKNLGNDEFIWHIIWELFPETGGSTGTPSTYTALVTADGSLVRPTIELWDATPVVTPGGPWISCRLPVRETKGADDRPNLSAEQIRATAEKRLIEFLQESDDYDRDQGGDPAKRFRFHGQQLLEIPLETGADRKLRFWKVWQVDLVDLKWLRKDQVEIEPFTVWVTEQGDVAGLKITDWAG